jgi:hypothetical protein
LLKVNRPDISEILDDIRNITDPKEKIRYALITSYSQFVKSSDILQIIRREIPEGKKYFQDSFKKFISDYLRMLSEAVKEGINKGVFRKMDPDIAAKAILTFLQGTIASSYLTEGTMTSQSNFIPIILDIIFQGIIKR